MHPVRRPAKFLDGARPIADQQAPARLYAFLRDASR